MSNCCLFESLNFKLGKQNLIFALSFGSFPWREGNAQASNVALNYCRAKLNVISVTRLDDLISFLLLLSAVSFVKLVHFGHWRSKYSCSSGPKRRLVCHVLGPLLVTFSIVGRLFSKVGQLFIR